MALFALIHGAGDVGWYWHLVEAELRARGHTTLAPDLPTGDDAAGVAEYADSVVEAIAATGDREADGRVVVVGQSLGGYVAPIVAQRVAAHLIVLVAAMVPLPGESAEAMFAATGWRPAAPPGATTREVFYHDVPSPLADEAIARGRRQAETPGAQPWPLDAWPRIPTRFVLGRDDRFFPAPWLRQVVRNRLGLEPIEIDSGHCPALSRPRELAELLDGLLRDVVADANGAPRG